MIRNVSLFLPLMVGLDLEGAQPELPTSVEFQLLWNALDFHGFCSV